MKATIKDIARESGVSISTVSNVINGKGKCSEETKGKVIEIMKKYNYKPNQVAQALITKSTRTIGISVILEEWEEQEGVLKELIKAVELRGYSVLLKNFRLEERKEKLREWVIGSSIDKLILIGNLSMDEVEIINKLYIKVLVIDDYNEYSKVKGKKDIYRIKSDDSLGGFEGTEALFKAGSTTNIFIGYEKNEIHERRYLGYQIAHLENFKEGHIPLYVKKEGKIGMKLFDYLKEKKVSGIVMGEDKIGFDFIKELKKYDSNYLKKLKIISFGNKEGCEYIEPSLSSLDLKNKEKAIEGINLLFSVEDERKKNDSEIYLKNMSIEFKIIKRETL